MIRRLFTAQNIESSTIPARVEAVFDAVNQVNVTHDKALLAWKEQVLTHLRHVRYDFRIEGEGYPHDLVLPNAYPVLPSLKAIRRAEDFLDVVKGQYQKLDMTYPRLRIEKEIKTEQKVLIKSITDDPMRYYQDYRTRLESKGELATFPEWSGCIDYLISRMRSDEQITARLACDPVLQTYAAMTVQQLVLACVDDLQGPAFSYRKMIDAIEEGVCFYDVVWRVIDPERAPPLYHSKRYEYYMHFLSSAVPRHVFLPTIVDLGVTDLLAVRGVPIGLIGVMTRIERVDGFLQTPYEFFIHDVNHARRMYQFAIEEAARQGKSDDHFFYETNHFMRDKIMPLFARHKESDSERRKVIKILLFEILHEDALPADPRVIVQALFRPPMQLTPFEKIEGQTVVYIMEPGATTLSYVYRKLAHTFYDAPDQRKDYIVDVAARQRAAVLEAGRFVLKELGLADPNAQCLIDYAYSDLGFPDDFRREVEADIERRHLEALGSDKPLSLLEDSP